METLIGLVLGFLLSILVSHYYFRRSINKRLGVYRLLNSKVFEGIAPDVRSRLNFRYAEHEVDDLQQLVFLIANDGDRAIANPIEPLTMQIAGKVQILDASIIHRHPDNLKLNVSSAEGDDCSKVVLTFPLLNAREFFVLKVLLSGSVSNKDVSFTTVTDDLPRVIAVKSYPNVKFKDTKKAFDGGLWVFSVVLLLLPACMIMAYMRLMALDPGFSPWPIGDFRISFETIFILAMSFIYVCAFTIAGMMVQFASYFGGSFPPDRGPKFILPDELRGAVSRLDSLTLMQDQLRNEINELETELSADMKNISENAKGAISRMVY
jgi:hypothetical protein